MSDNWSYQLSVKVGDALWNIRGDSADDFAANLAFAHKNASQVRAFCEDFKVQPQTHQTSGGAGSHISTSYPPTSPAPAAPFSTPPPGAHVVRVTGIEEKEGVSESSGKGWKKWTVSFDDGRKATTFDALVAAVAKKVYGEGAPCVAITKPAKNPKYTDLEAIQRAGAPV